MALTRDTMRSHVRDVMDVDEEDLPDAVLDLFLREGWDEIIAADDSWPWLYSEETIEVTPSNTPEVPIRDVRALLRRTGAEGMELQQIGWEEGQKTWIGTSDQSGTPRYWSISPKHDEIKLWPNPSTTFDLTVQGYLTPDYSWLDEAGDLSPTQLPEAMHPLIPTWALYKAYLKEEDTEMAQAYLQNFSTGLERHRKRQNNADPRRPIVMHRGIPARRSMADWMLDSIRSQY